MVAQVRAVPSPYATIAAAIAAASPGDTILISPLAGGGVHAGASVTKQVRCKGLTDDPVGNPVNVGYLSFTALGGTGMGDGSGIIFIEGLRIVDWAPGSGGIASTVDQMPFFTWKINRCVFVRGGYSYIWFGTPQRLVLTNCTGTANRAGSLWAASSGIVGSVEHWKGTNAWEVLYGVASISSIDAVITPTAGYGAGYGDWLYNSGTGAWDPRSFQVQGQVILPPGVDRSATQIRLFKEGTNGVIETAPWSTATPNPVTGEWSWPYLPTSYRYWVQTVPPAGYKPQIDGPFVPALA